MSPKRGRDNVDVDDEDGEGEGETKTIQIVKNKDGQRSPVNAILVRIVSNFQFQFPVPLESQFWKLII